MELYKRIASDYLKELTNGFDIGKFIDKGAANGKAMVDDLQTVIFGEALSLGGSVVGGVIGSFFLPPLGTVLGSLAGWGLGALAKQSFINAKK